MGVLPVFQVGKSTDLASLRECIFFTPVIFEVFDNIKLGRELDYRIDIDSYPMFNVLLDFVFLPLLEKHEIVRKNESNPSGFSANFSAIVVTDFDRKELAEATRNAASHICSSIGAGDTRENTAFYYVQVELDRGVCEKKIEEIHNFARRLLAEESSCSSGSSDKIKIAIASKIDSEKKVART